MESQRTVGLRDKVPHNRVQSLEAAVKSACAVVVGGKPVCSASVRIRRADYAVGDRPHHSTEKPLAPVVHIFVQSPMSENDVHHFAVSLWHPKRHDPAAVICRLEDHISVGNCPKPRFLAADAARKALRIDEERVVRAGNKGLHEKAGGNSREQERGE